MGKSDKKIKADRINALRKQYEEFLGEDKKRKERNEFILGRLDKMRSCTSVMQIRPMPNAYVDARSATLYNRSMHTIDKPSGSGFGVHSYPTQPQLPPLDSTIKNTEDPFLLHEISKKYILIPKSNTFINIDPCESFEAQSVTKKNIDNDDWKSKYEILAHLKQKEKEQVESPTHSEKYIDNVKEQPISDIKDEGKKMVATFLPESENEIDIPEKDLPDTDNTVLYKIKNPEGMSISRNEKREILIPPPESLNIVEFTLPEDNFYSYSYSDESKPQTKKSQNEPMTNIDKKLELQPEHHHSLPNEELAYHQQTRNENPSFEVDYEKQYQPAEEKYFENVVDPQENEMTPVEVINSGDLVGHINEGIPLGAHSQMTHGAHGDTMPQMRENLQYPIEIINPQDFTPNDNVKVWDGINVNPEGYGLSASHFNPEYQHDPQSAVFSEHVETTENNLASNNASANDVSSGIEAFNAEQRDMFYQEQVDEKPAYNQQVLVDAEYAQNENYELQYSCYEGTQEETPAEVNEQEETSQRYDPHYEQQYTPYTYEYEYPKQETQQPSIVVHLDEVQEYNQDKLNEETSENIQRQMDTEQGFVETQNEQMEPTKQEIKPETKS